MTIKPLRRLPQPWRKVVDWAITLAAAVLFVLAFEAEVAKPYRIPSASMETTLHCAGEAGCRGSTDDRVLVNNRPRDLHLLAARPALVPRRRVVAS